jgi:hypothetical protein
MATGMPSDPLEASHVIACEKIPLDNRHGSTALTMDYEVSRTITSEISIENLVEGSAEMGASLVTALKMNLATKLSERVGRKERESITRRRMLHLGVEAGKAVVYVITWKIKIRTGEYEVLLDNGAKIMIPYRIQYDIAPEITSHPAE